MDITYDFYNILSILAHTSQNAVNTDLDMLWMAPELLRDQSAAVFGTKPGDVYAFGIIMHEVFDLTRPYGRQDLTNEEIIEMVKTAEEPLFRPKVGRT